MRVASIFILIVAMPFIMAFSSQDVQQNPYQEVTNNTKIIKALDLLSGTSGEWAKKAILGSNLSGKPIKILFKNLSNISEAYASFDALGWRERNGQLTIYLSERHLNAPEEAIASILCHEAIHQDTQSSIEEETYGWTYEADVWIQMKKKNPELKNIANNQSALVNRLNSLETMFKKANYTNIEIKKSVSTNPGYYGLPLYSPGFEKKN